jgi:hypothetical protein
VRCSSWWFLLLLLLLLSGVKQQVLAGGKKSNEDAWKSTVDVDTGEENCFKEGRTTWTRPGRRLVGERVIGKLNW